MYPQALIVLAILFALGVGSYAFIQWWNARKAEKAAAESTDTTPGGSGSGASSGLGGTKPK